MEKKQEDIWINSVHDSIQDIRNVSQNLYSLSNSFSRTGNDSISNELREYAFYLDKSCKIINASIGKMLSDNVNEGNKEITQIFKILLDVCFIKKNLIWDYFLDLDFDLVFFVFFFGVLIPFLSSPHRD